MRQDRPSRILLAEAIGGSEERVELFALLNLGMIQSLMSGTLSASDALARFYHADNCLYVRKELRNRTADTIMARGVQLPDLFDALPAEEAQREFYRELETMRVLALKLLTEEQITDQAHQDLAQEVAN
jgi:hypothetical protein